MVDCVSRSSGDRACDPANPFDAVLGWTRRLIGHSADAAANMVVPGRRASLKEAPPPLEKKETLDLTRLNPSLYVIGLETVERLLPRYLTKAGVACERMQHAQLPVEVIRRVLEALFLVPTGESVQSEEALREVFELFDTSGDGTLDQDEFFAVLPLLGEDVPPSVVSSLFEAGDLDNGGTMDGAEFVDFMRRANPPAEGEADGWRAFLPETAAHFEEMVLLHLREGHRRGGGGDRAKDWEVVPADAPWSMSLLLPRADLANCQALVGELRKLGWSDTEVRTVAHALFVSGSDEDYARVFQVFDRDATGGIDPFEFRAITALLGDHSTELEARELFLEADKDNDGALDVAEFVALLRRLSPKARSASEAQMVKDEIARDRLQARIASSSMARVEPEQADAMVQVLALGASKAGKTYLLNQVLADKLPKGFTVAVGVGSLVVRIGHTDVALQVLDTPGDARFAPLGRIFYPSVRFALLVYDATSFESFEAVSPLLDAFVAANPGLDVPAHVCLVSNMARLGVKPAVTPGFALEWCQRHGGIPFFEVDAEAPQGILEPLQHIADEYLTANPTDGGGPGGRRGAHAVEAAPSTLAPSSSSAAAPWERAFEPQCSATTPSTAPPGVLSASAQPIRSCFASSRHASSAGAAITGTATTFGSDSTGRRGGASVDSHGGGARSRTSRVGFAA
jgi:Ca2+-binding EF-hand superfamily protein